MSNEEVTQWFVHHVNRLASGTDVRIGTSSISEGEANALVAARDHATPVCLHHFPVAGATDERAAFEAIGHRRGIEDALDIVDGRKVDESGFQGQAADLRARLTKIRNDAFIAGFSSARDVLATLANEAEATARGQATEAEQAQTRAAASATRAAVQRGGVALLDREIAALKGEGK